MSALTGNGAYDVVLSFPTLSFAARVARRGKYSAPIMDEFVIRVVDAAGEVSVATVGGLLRLSGAQLESFTEPMLRSGLLAFSDGGLLTLGAQGRQAMMQAAGEPPKLSRVEEATEQCAVDLFDGAFNFKPSDKKPPARFIEVLPREPEDRHHVRERVRQKLLEDYFDHLQYLELYRLRSATPKQIEYVIDLDDGLGDRGQISARIVLNDLGLPELDYPDLRAGEQIQKRRTLLGQFEATLSGIAAAVPPAAQQHFLEVAKCAANQLQQDDSLEAVRLREFWVDDGVIATGRIESRSRATIDLFIDRVIAESGLMRGGKERTLQWLVVLFPEPDLFVAGRAYRGFLDSAVARLKRRSPKLKVVAVAAHPAPLRLDKAFSSLFNAYVSATEADPALAAMDGLFIPDELACVTCADISGTSRTSPHLPRPRSVLTSRLDAVREVSRRIFGSSSLFTPKLDGISDAEWRELLSSLKRLTVHREGRVLRLGQKKKEPPSGP